MDVKLVARHVKDGHLFLDDLPSGKRAEVEAVAKSLKPLKKKKPSSK